MAVGSRLANATEVVPGETRHFLERGAWGDVRWFEGGESLHGVTRIVRDHVGHTEPRRRYRAFRNDEALEM